MAYIYFMLYQVRGLLLIVLLAVSACERRQSQYSGLYNSHNNIVNATESEKMHEYYKGALDAANYPLEVERKAMLGLSKWHAVQSYDFEPLTDYYTYFGNPLKKIQTPLDSVLHIAKSVYACANYGWIRNTIADSIFTQLNATRQYYAICHFQYNGTCAAFSDFLVKTLQRFGFKGVIIHLAIKGSNNDIRKHVAVAAQVNSKWYLIESTTGQMLLDSNARFMDYSAYLNIVKNRSLKSVQLTDATIGRFMQPSSAYTTSIPWIYGDGTYKPRITKHTSKHTTLKVKRNINTWSQQAEIRDTYITYLYQKYGEYNWLYMYDTANIIDIKGCPEAVAAFKNLYF